MKNIFTGLFLFFAMTMVAQVQKNVVVEHFTNTRCGICSSRNPGLFTNLNNNPNVIHLAVHPSSPYSSCILNQANPTENDGRTNYYGIYGSTPRIVVQGSVVSASTNFGDATIFSNQAGQTSPFTVRTELEFTGNGEVITTVIVKTEATHSFSTLKLFTAIAEDTIFYNAPNGENEHYNVFRESVFEVGGKTVTPATMVGDSVVFSETITLDANWDWSRILAISILQESGTKEVVQASTSRMQMFTSTEDITVIPFQLYSVNNQVVFKADKVGTVYQVQVFDLQGNALHYLNSSCQGNWVFDKLPTGIYAIRIQSEDKIWSKLLPIVN
ncbi:MAG: hypothetical protein AB8G11_12240 [Saprospiraceae bacterium]